VNATLASVPVTGNSAAAKTIATGANAKKTSLTAKSACDLGDVSSVERAFFTPAC
jgi:hypothetical protein